MWQPMPNPTSWSSSARVEMLCGQPEQKYGVRGAGSGSSAEVDTDRGPRVAPVYCSAASRAGEVLVTPEAGQRPGHEVAGHRPVARDERSAVAVLLAEDPGLVRVAGTGRP